MQPATIAPRETTYSLKLHLRYEIMTGMPNAQRGEGCTVSISRSQIVFEGSETLPIGRRVRLYIDWPVKLENRIGLTITIQGMTIAAQGQQTTIQILRYEFRTRALTATARA